MQATITQSVAEDTLVADYYFGYPLAMYIAIRVTDAAVLGTLTVTIRWTDRLLGAQLRNILVPITVLNSFVVVNDLWMDIAENTEGTIQFSVANLVGTFVADFNINQYQPSGF